MVVLCTKAQKLADNYGFMYKIVIIKKKKITKYKFCLQKLYFVTKVVLILQKHICGVQKARIIQELQQYTRAWYGDGTGWYGMVRDGTETVRGGTGMVRARYGVVRSGTGMDQAIKSRFMVFLTAGAC